MSIIIDFSYLQLHHSFPKIYSTVFLIINLAFYIPNRSFK